MTRHIARLWSKPGRDAVGLVLSSTNMDPAPRRSAWHAAQPDDPHRRSFQLSPRAAGIRDAGADIVFSGEGEVALAMTEFLLRQLGATAEQIDRERERIRSDLFGSRRPWKPLKTILATDVTQIKHG